MDPDVSGATGNSGHSVPVRWRLFAVALLIAGALYLALTRASALLLDLAWFAGCF